MLQFDILRPHRHLQPRIGRLDIPDRNPIETPNYVPVSSRGAIPHISQDTMREQTSIQSTYFALEDCGSMDPAPIIEVVEKQLTRSSPPVFSTPISPHASVLRTFTSCPSSCLSILGPRRIPPLPCPSSSTSTAISVVTSLGFSMLECDDYVDAAKILRPDIVVAMGDVVFGQRVGVKRMDCMGDRTLAWVRALLDGLRIQAKSSIQRLDPEESPTAIFAPILPISADLQAIYLDALGDEEQLQQKIAGLALYEVDSIEVIPRTLENLPRFYIGEIASPHQLLDAIVSGIDIFTVPFINEATDAGIALDFSLDSVLPDVSEKTALGLDLWSMAYATVLAPLSKGCTCYTCTYHHCAYVQHLLNAKEMLGWVLLQVHNHHTMDAFFAAIRDSIREGGFERAVDSFKRTYAETLPVKTGQGPRVRGYTFKSEGKGESKRNVKPWSATMRVQEKKVRERTVPRRRTDAVDMEEHDFVGLFGEREPCWS